MFRLESTIKVCYNKIKNDYEIHLTLKASLSGFNRTSSPFYEFIFAGQPISGF